MTLQFVLGTASKDHFKTMTTQLKKEFANHPDERFFYLIPNHIKFDAEVNTLKALNTKKSNAYAQTNIQILSLTRLAWFLFSQDAEYQAPRLSESAVNMLLYQIILDHQTELTVFRGEENHPGFINKLANEINDLTVGQISSEDLTNLLQTSPHLNRNLKAKLTDLTLIYQDFEKRTHGKYLHNTDLLQLFSQKIQQIDLSKMHFYISGFSQLSAQEMAIITTMITKSASVTIDLTLDRPATNKLPESPNLFFQPANLYYQLYQIARNNGIHVLTDIYAKDKETNADLVELDRFWINSVQINNAMPKVELNDKSSIQVIKADNPYTEIAKVALKIRQMVATGKYHYRDFVVMTRHLDAYQNMIHPVFDMQEIPFFEDVRKTMETHPLVELINALFMINPKNSKRSYEYSDVMRLLKTELLLPKIDNEHYMGIQEYRNDLSLTENLVLRNGYAGKRWTQKQDWEYININSADFNLRAKPDPDITKRVNVIRHFIKKILPPFFRQINKAKTGTEAIKVLYQFLIKNGVVDQLQNWRRVAMDNEDLNEAGQPEQVWGTFCSLLDDFAEILGDMDFNPDTFLDLLKAGFEGANYSQIPSTLDQVVITESGITQSDNYRVTFMIGSTDETMPDQIVNDDLIGDTDRDEMQPLLQADQFLPDDSETKMANSPFLNYEAFMTAKEQLIFTYSLNDDTNQESSAKRSPYVDRIVEHFQIQEQEFHALPDGSKNNVLPYVGTKRTSLRHLVQASYQSKTDAEPLADEWRTLYHELINTNDYFKMLTDKLLGGLNYNNRPKRLKPEIVTKLYSSTLNSSISQLEDFYKNPYEYFLTYGLSLKPRDEFELSSGNKGQFFHSVLEQTVSALNGDGIDIATVDSKKLMNLVGRISHDIVKNDQRYQILQSSNQMNYIQHLLIQTVQRMALTMKWQGNYTRMRPRQTEISFGQTGKAANLDPLLFDIDEKHHLRVRGRIDRIDAYPTEDKNFLAIVDYKSGNKDIKYDELYSGISIQLMTYLDVIKRNLNQFSQKEKAELAGALYLHIQDPLLSVDDTLNKPFEKAILKAQRYNGIIVDDAELLSSIKNDDLDKNKRSSLIYKGLRSNAKEEVKGRNVLVTNEQLTSLLDYTEQLIQRAGKAIFNGNIDLAPLKTDSFDAMKYTDYAPIMQFDPLLSENNYRQVNKMQLTDILKRIEKGDFFNELH